MASVFSAVRDLVRLREITSVLVRHGFGEVVTRAGLGRRRKERHAGASEPPRANLEAPEIGADDAEAGEQARGRISTAERIRLVAQELGPSFIKLGQIASTRTDVLPADIIAELKKLQDDVPPVDYAAIELAVETSLGRSLAEVYESFEVKPLATASIGQVHRAVLKTDEGSVDVVVKVQRPGVADLVARDLDLLHVIAATLERAVPETKLYSPTGLVQQFDRSISSELNFLVEAENCERFAKNFAGHEGVRFPRIYRQASSKLVLTQEFFPGKKVTLAARAGADGKIIAKKSVGFVIKMIFEDGFFHADPHPGNIIIMGPNDDPVVGVIDTGMVGRLSPELRDRTIDLMVAAVRNDAVGVADALYAIGRPTRKVDLRQYRAEVAVLAEKYLGRPMKEIDLSAMIRDLVSGAMKYGLEIPPDFLLVGKALMTIEGIGKELDPDLDVLGEASPYFINLLKARYSPERIGNELLQGAIQLSRASYDMPMQIREVLDDLRLGRLAVQVADPGLPALLDRAGRRVFSGLVIIGLLVSGGIMASSANHDNFGVALVCLGGLGWAGHSLRDAMLRGNKKR